MIPTAIALLLLGYVCGSIPFGLLIGFAKGVDVRKTGSGNVGATNVGRTLGRKWGIACFILDVCKGLIPVLIAGGWLNLLGSSEPAAAAFTDQAWSATSLNLLWLGVGAASVAGHIFPIWLKFKGGKGVATALGVLLGFWPVLTIPGIGAAITWIALALATRYISLASVGAAASLPVYLVVSVLLWPRLTWADSWPFLLVSGVLALLVIIRHRSNLARLKAGTEPKWGQKKTQPAQA